MTLYNILKLRAYLVGLLDWKSTGFNWFKNWATICFVSLDDLDYDLWHLGFSQSVRLGGHSFMTYTNKWPIFWPTSPPLLLFKNFPTQLLCWRHKCIFPCSEQSFPIFFVRGRSFLSIFPEIYCKVTRTDKPSKTYLNPLFMQN